MNTIQMLQYDSVQFSTVQVKVNIPQTFCSCTWFARAHEFHRAGCTVYSELWKLCFSPFLRCPCEKRASEQCLFRIKKTDTCRMVFTLILITLPATSFLLSEASSRELQELVHLRTSRRKKRAQWSLSLEMNSYTKEFIHRALHRQNENERKTVTTLPPRQRRHVLIPCV